MDLKNEPLSEKDYKQLILQEYTFLKRPVIIVGNERVQFQSSRIKMPAKIQYKEEGILT